MSAMVIDGDTLLMQDGVKVRLIGIDCPELNAPDPRRNIFGAQARDYVKRRLGLDPVTLTYEGASHDKYGRRLAYVWLKDGVMLNRELVELGYARVFWAAPFSYKKEFYRLQKKAKKERKGLWDSQN